MAPIEGVWIAWAHRYIIIQYVHGRRGARGALGSRYKLGGTAVGGGTATGDVVVDVVVDVAAAEMADDERALAFDTGDECGSVDLLGSDEAAGDGDATGELPADPALGRVLNGDVAAVIRSSMSRLALALA